MDVTGLAIAAAGAAILGGSIVGARSPTIHPAEARAFRFVNSWPDWLYVPLWLPMQLGNLLVGTVVGLVIAWVLGAIEVAVAVILAMALKLVVERVVRRELSQYMEVRQRPGTSEPGARLRGADVPHEGMSFPSGHVILVAAVGTVLTGHLDAGVALIPFLLAALVAVGRVFVGAHNPLDVTAGMGAGLLVGGILTALLS
ncbi:MAG TPA: phosphatase PAP2 family protein [Acidimicrobiales bacterium]|nr:phosphatase PAP2 family protein [Acidimicrobiales bacterium]